MICEGKGGQTIPASKQTNPLLVLVEGKIGGCSVGDKGGIEDRKTKSPICGRGKRKEREIGCLVGEGERVHKDKTVSAVEGNKRKGSVWSAREKVKEDSNQKLYQRWKVRKERECLVGEESVRNDTRHVS